MFERPVKYQRSAAWVFLRVTKLAAVEGHAFNAPQFFYVSWKDKALRGIRLPQNNHQSSIILETKLAFVLGVKKILQIPA